MQEWLKHEKVDYDHHAPVAERMIGRIKKHIIDAMQGTGKQWWEVVDDVVKYYNENHVAETR